MQVDDRLSGALQENILVLLCFDDKNCKIVRAALTPKLFDSAPYRELAGHAIDFIDQYGETIKEHLPDQIEHILEGDDTRKAETYRRLLENLFTAKDSVNGDYVIQQLHKFVRQQNLKSALVKAVEAMGDGRIDDAEVEMQKGLNTQSVAFDAGLSLSNAKDIESILEQSEEEGFELGIPELDQNGIIPRRKQLYMLMAARGRGKSWFITHCAKQAMVQRWSVVIITLEMSQRSYAGRFLQAFFSIGKRAGLSMVTRFNKDKNGGLDELIQAKIERPSLRDEDIKEVLMSRAKRVFNQRPPLHIKAWPTHGLDIKQLEAYLDGLERFEKFTPDAIFVDYPDLFKLDNKQMRIELGTIVGQLRGIAQERNCAMIAVTQGNRISETAQTITGDMVAEDISKLAHADVLLTYSQTKAEYALGLARIWVEKTRDEAGKFTILITQAYAIGQFCLDSIRIASDYWKMMENREEKEQRGSRKRRNDEDED